MDFCLVVFRYFQPGGWGRYILNQAMVLGIDGKLGGGGNSTIFSIFTPILGKMNPFWRAYFSDGLVQPPTSKIRLSAFHGSCHPFLVSLPLLNWPMTQGMVTLGLALCYLRCYFDPRRLGLKKEASYRWAYESMCRWKLGSMVRILNIPHL